MNITKGKRTENIRERIIIQYDDGEGPMVQTTTGWGGTLKTHEAQVREVIIVNRWDHPDYTEQEPKRWVQTSGVRGALRLKSGEFGVVKDLRIPEGSDLEALLTRLCGEHHPRTRVTITETPEG
jgi:hypothetical protein